MTVATCHALVAGGGIGGLSAALSLARSGCEVHLLEQAAAFAEIGAGLQVGPNATRMLERLGVVEQVLAAAVFPEHAVMRNAVTGQRLTTLDLGTAFQERYGFPYIVLHRSDLLSILLEACLAMPSILLENNKTVVTAWSSAREAGVRCADGSAYQTELLIGADGLNSTVRRLIDDEPPRNSTYVAYRGTLPMTEVKSEVADDDIVLWIGPGLHLMQYPIRRHELYNQVAVFRSERSTGSEEASRSAAEFHERFSLTCAEVRRHVSRIPTDRSWAILDRDPLDTWIAGRTVLLGDAAHPMLQYLGQGACQALEDSHVLGCELSRHPGDIDTALAAYQRRRLGRASRCQLAARPWGETWHTDDIATVALRDRLLRARQPDDYSELDWLYLEEAAS